MKVGDLVSMEAADDEDPIMVRRGDQMLYRKWGQEAEKLKDIKRPRKAVAMGNPVAPGAQILNAALARVQGQVDAVGMDAVPGAARGEGRQVRARRLCGQWRHANWRHDLVHAVDDRRADLNGRLHARPIRQRHGADCSRRPAQDPQPAVRLQDRMRLVSCDL